MGEAIVAGVERCLPGWVEAQVERILDAWGGLGSAERAWAAAHAREAGAAAVRRVTRDLRDLLARDAVAQEATPLEIVRTAYREPTTVLDDVGVPPVVREAFDERAWPEDRFGLVPRTLGDLGDDTLGPLHLAWGLAKSRVLRARRTGRGGVESGGGRSDNP